MLSDEDIERIEHLAEINAKLNNPGWKEMFALLADREAVIAKIEKDIDWLENVVRPTYKPGKFPNSYYSGWLISYKVILDFIRNPQGVTGSPPEIPE